MVLMCDSDNLCVCLIFMTCFLTMILSFSFFLCLLIDKEVLWDKTL